MAKLVILTLTLQEAKALFLRLPQPHANAIPNWNTDYIEAYRKLGDHIRGAEQPQRRKV
jgi:hypothetical protein